MKLESKLEVLVVASIVLAVNACAFWAALALGLIPFSWIGFWIGGIGTDAGLLSTYFALLRLRTLHAKQT